jgi:hypothetical protein
MAGARGRYHGARDGELVEAEQAGPKGRMGLPRARIVERLGDPGAPKAVSLIAIHEHGIPDAFPDEVIEEADHAEPAGLSGRDRSARPAAVTIDPADARDRDDAVHAHADDDPKNPGGHVIWVAIADVAHYVRPGSALDREAKKRGNSTYFPDRVVPMLPDRCRAICAACTNVPRACLAVRMVIGEDGTLRDHRFVRGLMRSRASLEYSEVQAAQDGDPVDRTADLIQDIIAPLYAAYAALRRAREAPTARPRPAGAADRVDRGRACGLRGLQGPARCAPDDRGVHGAGQCRRRRDAGRETLAAALPRARGAAPEKIEALRETARGRGLHPGQGAGAEDRAAQPPVAAGRRAPTIAS